MGKHKDLTGQRFDRWTVLYEIKERRKKKIFWRCLCDCGNKRDVDASSLTIGNSKSCGCYNKERISETKTKDLIGKRFGQLMVLYRVGSTKSKKAIWHCLCDCGIEKDIVGRSLLSGYTKSCGYLVESFIAFKLKKYFVKNYNAETEYKILKNPNTNYWLPYDIYIFTGENPKINGIYIEINGKQHYYKGNFNKLEAKKKNTTSKKVLEYQKYRDNLKKEFAEKNGIYIEIDLRKIETTEKAILYIENVLNKKDKNGN